MTRIRSEQRYELKYLVPHHQSTLLAALLSEYMLPDHHGDAEGQYQVTSLYYDTVDHKAYWDRLTATGTAASCGCGFMGTGR